MMTGKLIFPHNPTRAPSEDFFFLSLLLEVDLVTPHGTVQGKMLSIIEVCAPSINLTSSFDCLVSLGFNFF